MATTPGLPFRRLSSAVPSRAGACGTIAAGEADSDDDGLRAFFRVRPRLFGIAYRMLGSVAEAEDTLQDVWLRWQTADRRVVRDAPAFLARTTTRLAINVIQSARLRRESHAERWLPEPMDAGADPG